MTDASVTDNDQAATAIDANGNRTGYAHDAYDRPYRTYYPTPTTSGTSSTTDYEQLSYDGGSRVTQRRLRDGQVIGYGYDNLDRRVADDNPNTSINIAEADVAYTYDNLGHLLSAVDTNGWSNAAGWDALGRMVSQVTNVAATTFLYDAAGRRTRQTWGDGFYVAYGYDATGAVTTISQNGSSMLATYAYDNLGRRTTLTRANGVVTSYGYDTGSRLTSLGLDLAGTAHDQTLTFGYNLAGQITTRSAANDAYAWTGAVNATRNYTANGLNQYTAAGTVTPTYDGRGNLTNAGGPTYTYNSRNQLFTAGTGTLFYANPAGLLTQQTVAGSTIFYDWVGGQLATEAISGGAIQRRYVYGPGADELLTWYEGSGTTDRRWPIADERGSIVAVAGNSGAAQAINAYSDYGAPQTTNPAWQGRFGYTGQLWVEQLQLWYYKARMYSATLGRFLQNDPIGYGDGLNWYAYVGNDPVNRTDPWGLATTTLPKPPPPPHTDGDDVTVTGRRQPCTIIECGVTGLGNIASLKDALQRSNLLTVLFIEPSESGEGAEVYNGCTLGSGPTYGRKGGHYPDGRINSGRSGDFNRALADLNAVASLNGVTELGGLDAPLPVAAQITPGFTGYVGGGWSAINNPRSGWVTYTHGSGLAFRLNIRSPEVRVEIPPGFKLPDGSVYKGLGPEVCHYPR